MSTTSRTAARSIRRTRAIVSQRASTVDPQTLHRSGTTPRAGPPRWAHTRGATPQAFHFLRDTMPCHPQIFNLGSSLVLTPSFESIIVVGSTLSCHFKLDPNVSWDCLLSNLPLPQPH